ncbi:MAG: carboxypeptidase regulatory-like domain-containing protein [Armatimonadota bacterium]
MTGPFADRTLATLSALLASLALSASSATHAAHNPYGVHLLPVGGDDIEKHLTWAHTLIGDGGHVKCLFGGIDANTTAPNPDWVRLVQGIYDRDMIPVLRLAGHYAGDGWVKPQADAPGDYTSVAKAVQAVVAGLPRREGVPLYVEVWNEPNLDLEWSGQASAEEYGEFLVDVHAALKALGDERIQVLNGATALDPEFVREMFEKVPASAHAFDVWASHPYPQNHPPEYNIHDNTARYRDATIDGYLLELEVLREFGRPDAKVMVTETAYVLGNQLYRSEGYPIIDEQRRADYIMRAFRDYWSRWPEVLAVFPFIFVDAAAGWRGFEWVHPGSGTDENGWPTKRHLQYDYVAKLAKPNDPTGGISGRVVEPTTRQPAVGVRVELDGGADRAVTDAFGNFMFAQVQPGRHTVSLEARGLTADGWQPFEVQAGQNAVHDLPVRPRAWAELEGTVREAGTDRPLSRAFLRLWPGGATEASGPTGRFLFPQLLPGEYSLEASLFGHGPARTAAIRVRPGRRATAFVHLGPLPIALKGDNMLTNPGFEQAATGQGIIAWSSLDGQPHREIFQPEQGLVHGGTGALAIHLPRKRAEWSLWQATNYNSTTPGTVYAAGAWVAAKELPAGKCRAKIVLRCLTNGGEHVGQVEQTTQLALTGRWQPLVVSLTAPERAQRLQVLLSAEGSRGIVLFDDVCAGEAG